MEKQNGIAGAAIVHEGECGKNLVWKLDEAGVLTLCGSGYTPDYKADSSWQAPPWSPYKNDILSVVIGPGVNGIGNDAFLGCSRLGKVSLPAGVIFIGSRAFEQCTSLTEITLPDSITEIGYDAFSGCTALTRVVLPESLRKIDAPMFAGCTALRELTVPANADLVFGSAFLGCSALETLSVAPGNRKYHASGNCIIRTESRILTLGCKNSVIPRDGSVTCIDADAFNGCADLREITIPESVTEIGINAFFGCKSLERITIPGNVTELGRSAFQGCRSLASLTIMPGLTVIKSSAFQDCVSLTEVLLPDSLTRIDDEAFKDCAALTRVTFPDGLSFCGNHAFSGCGNLRTLPPQVFYVICRKRDAEIGTGNEEPVYLRRKIFGGEPARHILDGAAGWKMLYTWSQGEDYGYDQHSSEGGSFFKEIPADCIIAENGEFAGVLMQSSSQSYGGNKMHYDSDLRAALIRDWEGKPLLCKRGGESFSSDDHERWDVYRYDLVSADYKKEES